MGNQLRPSMGSMGTTWETIWGPYIDNSESFDSLCLFGGSWACFPLLLQLWGLMGLVPKCRGQHRPDSPHLLKYFSAYMYSADSNEARITSCMSKPLMHERANIFNRTYVYMYITLMNISPTENGNEIHPLTVTCT